MISVAAPPRITSFTMSLCTAGCTAGATAPPEVDEAAARAWDVRPPSDRCSGFEPQPPIATAHGALPRACRRGGVRARSQTDGAGEHLVRGRALVRGPPSAVPRAR